jgi:hypothetical protein
MQDLKKNLVNNEEDNLIKELRHTSVITKEKLNNLKTDVTVAIDGIRMEPGNYMHIKVHVKLYGIRMEPLPPWKSSWVP